MKGLRYLVEGVGLGSERGEWGEGGEFYKGFLGLNHQFLDNLCSGRNSVLLISSFSSIKRA